MTDEQYYTKIVSALGDGLQHALNTSMYELTTDDYCPGDIVASALSDENFGLTLARLAYELAKKKGKSISDLASENGYSDNMVLSDENCKCIIRRRAFGIPHNPWKQFDTIKSTLVDTLY